jgi:radical SAM superfamily enzyme YgiQ (UPF0313 family)
VIFLGPGEQTFPQFLREWRAGAVRPQYDSADHSRTLVGLPPVRRDLIHRQRYLVPNSIVVTRGCPFHCDFCYKDAFFEGGKTFYTQTVDDALAEIDRLPGRHLYFLDDHLLGNRTFARDLFNGMKGMNRIFQGAATVDSILKGPAIEQAAAAGLRSIFVGFESLDEANLRATNKGQNLGKDYARAIRRLDDLGIMINGSFVFGLDNDGPDVFQRTVDWAIRNGITTATFHVATPYPGTGFFKRIESQGRLLTRDWDLYDTRHAVFQPARMTTRQLEEGYRWAYREFYTWQNIAAGATHHATAGRSIKHFVYAAGWKKFEPLWNAAIKTKNLRIMRPMLEGVLKRVRPSASEPVPRSPRELVVLD